MMIIGHRGCAGLEPENTMIAFKRAIELGVTAVELDVRITRDAKVIVIHDPTLDRTTNMKGSVSSYSYGELEFADAGKGQKIPLLLDVLNLLKDGKVFVHIELKDMHVSERVLEIVKESGMIQQSFLISFWHKELVKAKKLSRIVRTGAIIVHNPVNVKNIFEETMVDFVSVAHDMTDRELVQEVHSLEKQITVWGKIDNNEKIDRLLDIRVDGIASDYPDRLIKRLKELNKG